MHTRLADQHPRHANRSESSDIDLAQTSTHEAQHARRGIGARGQRAFARRDGRKRRALRVDRIERRDRVGMRRQGVAGIDAHRRGRQRRRCIGTGVGRLIGAEREAVAERDRRRRPSFGDFDIRRERLPERRRDVLLTQRDRLDRGVELLHHLG